MKKLFLIMLINASALCAHQGNQKKSTLDFFDEFASINHDRSKEIHYGARYDNGSKAYECFVYFDSGLRNLTDEAKKELLSYALNKLQSCGCTQATMTLQVDNQNFVGTTTKAEELAQELFSLHKATEFLRNFGATIEEEATKDSGYPKRITATFILTEKK